MTQGTTNGGMTCIPDVSSHIKTAFKSYNLIDGASYIAELTLDSDSPTYSITSIKEVIK